MSCSLSAHLTRALILLTLASPFALAADRVPDVFPIAEADRARAYIVVGDDIDDYDEAVLDFVRVIAIMTSGGTAEPSCRTDKSMSGDRMALLI